MAPQVAQFVAINQKASTFPQDEFIQYLGKDLSARFGDKLPDGSGRRSVNSF